MIPQKGHLAMIIPDFAKRDFRPGEIGLYEYRGRDGWVDHSASGPGFLRLEWI